MSLGIVIKAPEGIVLATESRVTMFPPGPFGHPIPITFDNATKLLSFGDGNSDHSYVGAVTYGQAVIGQRTAHSFLPEFNAELPEKRLKVDEFARNLSAFYKGHWERVMPPNYNQAPMIFVVGGFDANAHYGRIFEFALPYKPDPEEYFPKLTEFGLHWGGQREFVERMTRGYDPSLIPTLTQALNLQPDQVQKLQQVLEQFQTRIAFDAMPLQDCVDLAIFYIRTTISMQNLSIVLRSCGGPIDVATITRQDGLKYVQRKRIRGEVRTSSGFLEEGE